MVSRTTVVVAPTLPATAKLTRFHGNATEKPLYTIVTWTSRHGRAGPVGVAPVVRKRQLALETGSNRLLEVQRVGANKDKNRSWFIGNHVQQDGSMVMLTPMDPLFVLLHAVIDQKDRYLSTYDLLSRDKNVWWLQLGPALTQTKIEQICDIQYTGDDAIDNLYVRVNEAKALQWLSSKVERVAAVLAKRAASAATTGAFDTKFVLPGQSTPTKQEELPADSSAAPTSDQIERCHGDAIEIIADYLPPSLASALRKQFNISSTTASSSTTAEASTSSGSDQSVDAIRRFDRRANVEPDNTTPAKRLGSSSSGGSSGTTKKKSKLANVDRSGMKSIASFFGKK